MKQGIVTSSRYANRGFTIVELLIVVVIIAILAAITIVAYNSIQQRARNSAARSALSTLHKKIQTYYTLKNTYPSATTGFATALNSTTESTIPSSVLIGTPTPATGTTTVQVEVCGAVAGTYGLGMRLTGWDYSTNALSNTPTLIGTTTACALTS